MLDNFFQLTSHNTSVKQEVMAGATTFLTMAYILFINPLILAQAGMDQGAVFVATCLAATFGCLVMGLLANYPVALAPSMGLNVFFTYTVVGQMGYSWQVALGAVFVSGMCFLLLSVFQLKHIIIEKIPLSLRQGISTGVGLYLAVIALKLAGIITVNEQLQLALGDLVSFEAMVWGVGILIITGFAARRWRGGVLVSILVAMCMSLYMGHTNWVGIFSLPPDISPTYLQMDIGAALDISIISIIFSFVFVDLFDTATSLRAVAHRGGLLSSAGSFPRFGRALFADASATIAGATLGTSTTTSYVESTSGVATGGRTGLTAIVVGGLFLLAIFVYPLIQAVPLAAASPIIFYVAVLMLANLINVQWEDLTAVIPVVLTVIMMPLTLSITNGIAIGFISYCFVNVVSGHAARINIWVAMITLYFISNFFF